ncbi:histidinol-phosphate transaminase [Gammaproteobacteria bacterium PRO2]|nr:histidinol-phosphate transaminase [Gammaproteobacteria bacterium PRO2]
MSSILDLVRPEIRRMKPYRSAQFADGLVRLNANESPWRPPGDQSRAGFNRYPEPRPSALTAGMAAHYGVTPAQLLVTRGSSEAIDVVIRGFCRAGRDGIVICPPTFGMYETYAQIQDAPIRRIALLRERGFALDVAGILDQWSDATRVLFLCSPNNPTGNSIPVAQIHQLAAALAGRAAVVVDAAYAEFSATDPTQELLGQHANIIVLRTLSKAMSLAGVRCGALLAAPELVALLGCVLPPYTFPAPCAEAVERCLEPGNAAEWRRRVERLRSERSRLAAALERLPDIRRVWPSDANFLLVEAVDAPRLVEAARRGGVLLRDFSWDPDLPVCVRITVGDTDENDQLLGALARP